MIMTDENNDQDTPRKSIRDEIAEVILALSPSALAEGDQRAAACTRQADGVLSLLNERGHYLPGCPPAAQILRDAEQFAGQFMLAMLVVRLQRLQRGIVQTPESKGQAKWLDDYVDGKNHGPVGKPMLWPRHLPHTAELLRKWGYQPTTTNPAFVARATPGAQAVTIQ